MSQYTPPATVTVPEAAALLGVCPDTLYAEIRRTDKVAGVRVMRIGRTIKISRELLERAIRGELPERAA